jgi:hypothetical protein
MLRSDTSTTLPATTEPEVETTVSGLMPTLAAKIGQVTGTNGPHLLSRPAPQHGASWTCPRTGIVIPKTIKANLLWRRRLLNEASASEPFQRQLRAACAASPWFWINGFCWTYRPKRVNELGEEVPCLDHEAHVPFVTWLVQDEFIGELQDAIDGGHDVLIDKSRDMGASWLCLTVLHHYWQFRRAVSFLELSRKEELVDSGGNMDSLFEKHRYLLKWQPAWLKPRRVADRYMHLANLDLESTIHGESTNGDAGRGGRHTAVLCDEFAAVQNGADVDMATADATACRIFNSTPKGVGTQHHKIWKEKRARILTLPWWRHPEKGRDAYQIADERGRPKWTSAWYQQEAKRRDRKAMAQEIDMDHGKAGDAFFDEDEIEKHRAAHERAPLLVGNILVAGDLGDKAKARLIARNDPRAVAFVPDGHGDWRFWMPLVNGRPPQDMTYVLTGDVATGSNGSNSVLTATCEETGQIVAKFWSARLSPEAFAEMAAFAGVWFGGRIGCAFVCWENNGPGGIFGRKIIKLGYQRVYYQRVEGTQREDKTTRYGWHSNQNRKQVLLARYREALARDKVINPCRESLDECLGYVYDENGKLIPGRLRQEAGGGQELHGDHVIADALAVLALAELPKQRNHKPRPPAGSFAARREQHQQKLKNREDIWRR